MNVYIHFKNVPKNKAAKDYIRHRLSFSLSRLQHLIQSINITLSDINGPRGGLDQQCTFVIKALGIPDIIVTEAQTSQESAINRCISRANMALARQVKRRQRIKQNNTRLKRNLLRNNTYKPEYDKIDYDDDFNHDFIYNEVKNGYN